MSDEEDRIIAYDEMTEFTFIDYLRLMAWYRERGSRFPPKGQLLILKTPPHEPTEWDKYVERYRENPTQLSRDSNHQEIGHDGAANGAGADTEPCAAVGKGDSSDRDGTERPDQAGDR